MRHHETGGDPRADLLKDADSLSFFQVNLPHYYARNSVEETRRRCLWGYRRLSEKQRRVVATFRYPDKTLESLLKAWIAERPA